MKPGTQFTARLLTALLVSSALLAGGCSQVQQLFSGDDAAKVDEDHTAASGDAPQHGEGDAHEAGEHDEEASHEEGVVHLSPSRLAGLRITAAAVRRGSATTTLTLPAETAFDPDNVAHLVPRVAGIVREVHKGIGDRVVEGELIAVVDSRELAQAKSNYLAAVAMRDLARTTYEREQRLWSKKISSEEDYLEAKQSFEEAKIRVTTTEQQLHALGLSEEEVAALPDLQDTKLTRYEIRAPFDATVIERHITLGETVREDDRVFFIARLDPMWVMGQASERDIRRIETGRKALIELDAYPDYEFEGRIDYVASALDPQSRTVDVRVILPNPDRQLRAHMFGRMIVFLEELGGDENLLVPADAVQRTDTGSVVYKILEDGVFRQLPVQVLRASDEFAEIRGDLHEGDHVAAGDTFVLKSEVGKAEMGGGHHH